MQANQPNLPMDMAKFTRGMQSLAVRCGDIVADHPEIFRVVLAWPEMPENLRRQVLEEISAYGPAA